MKRVYKTQNVYDATQERLDFMFSRFERIYLSFSGGKDSGVMLNLVADYMRKHKISMTILLNNPALLGIYPSGPHGLLQPKPKSDEQAELDFAP